MSKPKLELKLTLRKLDQAATTRLEPGAKSLHESSRLKLKPKLKRNMKLKLMQ